MPVPFRDAAADRAIDVLTRIQTQVPVIVGAPRVGKTSVIDEIVRKISLGEIPAGAHAKTLNEAFILQTSAAQLQKLAQYPYESMIQEATQGYLEELLALQAMQRTPILLVIDDAHLLKESQIKAIKPFLATTSPSADSPGLRLILGASTADGSAPIFGDPQLKSMIEEIRIFELSAAQTEQVLLGSTRDLLQKQYRVILPDEVIRAAIQVAGDLKPDVARPDGPFQLLQHLSIAQSRAHHGEPAMVSVQNLYEFAATESNLPVLPRNRAAFLTYLESLKERVKKDVIGQDQIINRVVDLVGEALLSHSKKTRQVLITGTTGTGKSYIARMILKAMVEDYESLMTEIDGTILSKDDHGFTLSGPSNGYRDSEKKGLLADHIRKVGYRKVYTRGWRRTTIGAHAHYFDLESGCDPVFSCLVFEECDPRTSSAQGSRRD